MNEKILQLITEYGLEATVLALGINVLTGLVKMPVKAWSKKLADGNKLTRYLVFLPVALGLLLTVLYVRVTSGSVKIDRSFMTLWATSSSLSMTFYAFWEKLFPTKERILKDYEIEANRKLLEEIKALAGLKEEADVEKQKENDAPMEAVTAEKNVRDVSEKIILRGCKADHEEAEFKKKSV